MLVVNAGIDHRSPNFGNNTMGKIIETQTGPVLSFKSVFHRQLVGITNYAIDHFDASHLREEEVVSLNKKSTDDQEAEHMKKLISKLQQEERLPQQDVILANQDIVPSSMRVDGNTSYNQFFGLEKLDEKKEFIAKLAIRSSYTLEESSIELVALNVLFGRKGVTGITQVEIDFQTNKKDFQGRFLYNHQASPTNCFIDGYDMRVDFNENTGLFKSADTPRESITPENIEERLGYMKFLDDGAKDLYALSQKVHRLATQELQFNLI